MRTTRKVMSVEHRSRSEWAASAKRPRLPDNRPTRSLRAAKLPLATIEAVVTACLESVAGSFPTSLFESHSWLIPSSGFKFVGPKLPEERSSGVAGVQELQNGAAALRHSHVIADFTGPCAMISRYRLEAYATSGELKNSRIGLGQWP
jgi:hypothetical protein